MISRNIFPTLCSAVETDDLILLIGARQVGKTTLLQQLQAYLEPQYSVIFLSLEDPDILYDLNQHPANLLQFLTDGKTRSIVLLDEIQYLDNPSNFLKYHYDLNRNTLKVFATGSSAFYLDQKFKDSLAGRKQIFEILPLSFSEFLRAANEVQLADKVHAENPLNQKRRWLNAQRQKLMRYWDLYQQYGGYPKIALTQDRNLKQSYLNDLIHSFLKKDIYEARIHHEEKFYKLLRLVAEQTGQLLNSNELANTLGLSHETVQNYLYLLQRAFIIRLCHPFSRNLRKELTKMPKAYFFDHGLRNTLLRTVQPIMRHPYNGAALENIFFTELLKRGIEDIRYWRTQDQAEVDFIVDEQCAFEVKLHARQFKSQKYQRFTNTYPDLPLHALVLNDEEALDVLDISQ